MMNELDEIQIPYRKGQFEGKGAPIGQGHSVVSCAQTAKLIDLSFGCELGWAEGSTSSIVFARWR